MKAYELPSKGLLTRRTPIIVRVDGKSFHTWTKANNFKKPFDKKLMWAMVDAAKKTTHQMQGFQLCYIQSDEASFLLTDYAHLETEPWFGYEIQKIVSITAAMMTGYLAEALAYHFDDIPIFDARVFNIPREEVANYYLWRSRDWHRNSVQMLGQAHFSHKELHEKKLGEIILMLEGKDVYWDKLPEQSKNGTFFTKNHDYEGEPSWFTDVRPDFKEIASLVEPLLLPEEE
jgi:tRNA(His) 5'-end guanylyltransferase